ncbi:MAG: DUF3352 domain-containing protein [Solirubrobacterales bacterium]
MRSFRARRGLKKRAPLIAPALALALFVGGCGSDDGSDALSGPATVMPAGAPIYVEATIRPDGEQAENLDALLSALGELPLIGNIGDPGELLIQQIEAQATAAGIDFSYADDIEPWLGERAAFSVFSSDSGDDLFVVAIEATDEDQARESIDALLAQGPVEYSEEEYEGVSYLTAPGEDFSLGVFDGHLVFATTDQFEAAVDASNGESLAESDKLAESLASVGDDSLGSFYLDLAQLEDFAASPEDAEGFEQFRAVAPEIFEGAITVSAGVSASDQVYIDYSTPLFEGQPEAGESPLLGTAPGDSLGAFALSDLGSFGQPIVDIFERAQDEGADIEGYPEGGIEQAFEDETGIPFGDAVGAIGDGSLFVRGGLPDDIEIGGEVEVSDTEVATDLIEALEAQIEKEGSAKLGPPIGGSDVGFSALEEQANVVEIDIRSGSGRSDELLPSEIDSGSGDLPFANIELDGDVIRYGFFRDQEAAEESNLDGAGEFSETEAFAAGEEAVGDDFEYLGAVDLAPILDEFVGDASIADALGGASAEALITGFLADKLGVVAVGQRYEDDVSVQRYVLRLAE